MKIIRTLVMLTLAISLTWGFAWATETEFWQIGSFRGFLAGHLQGISASMNGQLMLAPETRAVFNPDETVALSVVGDNRGNVYIGTGHQGKVFKLDSELRGKLLFQAPEPEILALAVGPDHDLYVGSSPEGKIYRVTPDGKSSVFYNPRVKYIWALAFDSHGDLYAGTGDRGEILKISSNGTGKVFFASDQTHIMCLTFDKNGNLLAGSEPGGLIYRLTPDGKAFELYQSSLPEIHALATDAEGRIYAAALGSMQGPGGPAAFPGGGATPVISGPVETVTVTASSDEAADPAQAPRRAPRHAKTPSVDHTESAGVGAPFHGMELGRGELIQILPNYSAQTLWASDRASIFGLATRGDDVLFSTDANGHIFDLRPGVDGPQLTLVTETRESLPTRLLAEGSNLFVATSNIAKLIRVGSELGTEGVYESPVKDARFISHWGQLSWRAAVPAGSGLQFYTRSGNSERPDNTWSDWSGPYEDAKGSPILSTPARYMQWKAVFHGSGGVSPVLNAVTLSYLNQNLAPQIHSMSITDGTERMSISGTPIGASGFVETASSITTVSSGPIISGAVYGSPSASEMYASGKPPIIINWVASDPNHDQLVYNLYIKSAREQEWHLLKGKLRGDTFNLEPDTLANGEYQVRLMASDAPSNAPDQALEAEIVSAPFWVDNTPPALQVVGQEVNGGDAVIHFEANTQVAPLRSAEVSVGENNWHQILSDDGIVDSRHEMFTVKLHHLSPGEHVVSLRATDTAGNLGVGTAVIEVH
jgi:hypothetical protein